MPFQTPAAIKLSASRDDLRTLRDAYIFCAERLKEIGSAEVAVPPGNRYIGGFAHGMRQCARAALEFEHLQESLRNLGKLLGRYGQESARGYDLMLYQRYNYEGEVVLVPDHWDRHQIAANIARVRMLGPDESKWS